MKISEMKNSHKMVFGFILAAVLGVGALAVHKLSGSCCETNEACCKEAKACCKGAHSHT